MKYIDIIVPIYNEEKNIEALYLELTETLNFKHKVIFINDGSTDNSQAVILKLSKLYKNITFLEFSRNFGYGQAIKAGLLEVSSDAAIIIDADLQHPPSAIQALVNKWQEGFEVVYAIRDFDIGYGVIKSYLTKVFYKFYQILNKKNIPGANEFLLLDAKAVKVINAINDPTPFIRGLVYWSGFNYSTILYTPRIRNEGETKFSLSKMLSYALSGFNSFESKIYKLPLYIGWFFTAALPIFIYFFNFTIKDSIFYLMITIQFFVFSLLADYFSRISLKDHPHFIVKNKFDPYSSKSNTEE